MAGPKIGNANANLSARTPSRKSVYDSVGIVVAAEDAAHRAVNRPRCGGQSPGTGYRDH